jgi:hypothetical protein
MNNRERSNNREGEQIETILYRGKKYRRVASGYTLREYFSHSTPEKGPGPGWDTRAKLLDEDYTAAVYGRVFSPREVYDNPRELLPDEPHYNLELVED